MTDIDLTAFYGQFRDETWENLNLLEQGLTALEANPGDTALIDRMLRAVHTTKGSAKIMGFAEINRLAHQMEEVLGAIRKGSLALTPEVGNALLRASHGIRALTTARLEGRGEAVDLAGLLAELERLLGPRETHPEAAPVVTLSAPSAGPPRETMRVDMEQVDHLSRLVGETRLLQEQARRQQALLEELLWAQEETKQALRSLKETLKTFHERLRPRQIEELTRRLERLESCLEEQNSRGSAFGRQYTAWLERSALNLAELQQQVLAIRMVPIGSLFEVFPGVVRRLAGECGVEVALEVQGAEVELDRRVLDLLREPLVHLVRNALSHGIEPPEERLRLGKPPRGRLLLEAQTLGRRVHIRVQDDGRGIDLEKVRRIAVERGLLEEREAEQADERTLLELLFRPAFSTRRQADEMAGRGVGLDVVQATMRRLNGLVQVETSPGRGTAFILDVPLTLATIPVLLVEAAGETLAIPSGVVRGLVRLRPQEIVHVEGHPVLYWQERPLSLLTLAQVLGLAAGASGQKGTVAVIAGSDGHQVALTVDRLLDEMEAIVQPLGEILSRSPYFSAATISEAGQVIPILDLSGLLSARPTAPIPPEHPREAPPPPRDPPRILLVEDTLITRELERSILEAAGYRVETAQDGLDALQKLERGTYHLVITDIEMPRLDGLQLTARIRQNPRWANLPIVIITAYADEERRRQGMQLGAQAYITKSRFDQGNLLETVAHLVG
ncbi:MAG: hybrid sensor histidine kinase/response regulator [Chloroflexia bacterium]